MVRTLLLSPLRCRAVSNFVLHRAASPSGCRFLASISPHAAGSSSAQQQQQHSGDFDAALRRAGSAREWGSNGTTAVPASTHSGGTIDVDMRGLPPDTSVVSSHVRHRGSANATQQVAGVHSGAPTTILSKQTSSPTPVPPPPRQTIRASCTAESYEFDSLLSHLMVRAEAEPGFDVKVLAPRSPTHLQGVYAVTLPADSRERLVAERESASVIRPRLFYFESGSFVSWGLTLEQYRDLKKDLEPFETGRFADVVVDSETMSFETDAPETEVLRRHDLVSFARNISEEEQLKYMLATSYGLQQTVKLSSAEEVLAQHVQKLRTLPDSLVTSPLEKYIPYRHTRRLNSLNRSLAAIMRLRYKLSLVSDMSETPELFWEDPMMEDVYTRVMTHFDVDDRLELTYSRLDHAEALVQSLRSSLHDDNSTKLEVYIIILIAAELARTFV